MRALFLATVVCGLLLADGGLFVPQSSAIVESGQTAIIKLADGREELSVATQFSTSSTSLAWLIPLPSEPAVDSTGIYFFYQLESYCAPIQRVGYGLSCWSGAPLAGERNYSDSTGVREIGSGIIGDYTYLVLQAFGADTLVSYLTGQGYELPTGTRDAFEHYLNQGWNYFFVARVADTSGYYYGRSLGIKLTFPSDSIVYPLYISRISSSTSYVTFYVLVEHRQMFRGAQLRFSGKIDQTTFPEFIDRSYHLTKLTKTFAPGLMEDITFKDAPDDQEFREINYGGGYMPMLLGFFLIVPLLLRRRRKGRP